MGKLVCLRMEPAEQRAEHEGPTMHQAQWTWLIYSHTWDLLLTPGEPIRAYRIVACSRSHSSEGAGQSS